MYLWARRVASAPMSEMTAGALPTSILISTHITFQDCIFVARGAIQQVTAISTEDKGSNCSHYYHTKICYCTSTVVMLDRNFISAPGYDHMESLGGRGGEGLIINYVKVP